MPGLGLTSRSGGELLRDRDVLLRQFVPELTGLALGSNRRVRTRYARGADLPVLLIAGRRGTGKTAVLRVLARGYARRVPLAHLDLADQDLSWPSPMAAVLFRIAGRVAGPVHGQRHLHCLRLALGLLAVSEISVQEPGDPVAISRARALLSLKPPGPEGDAPQASGGPLKDLADSVIEIINAPADGRKTAMVTAVEKLIAARIGNIRLPAASRRGNASLRWYAERYPEAHNGRDALVMLSTSFSKGGDERRLAESVLIEALLADIRDAFAGLRGRNRVVRPLLLLDNADDPGRGVPFIRAVLGLRDRQPADHVVIVGTARDITGFPDARAWELQELAAGRWQRGTGPGGGAVIVDLPPLPRDDTLRVVASAAAGQIQPGIVHRMTQGNPLGVSVLAGAIRRAGNVSPDGMSLLSLPAAPEHGDGDVLTVLLKLLIPGEQARGRLIALAPAETAEEAAVLARSYVGGKGTDAAGFVRSCLSLLRQEGWGSGDEFIGDPFLRFLLLSEFFRSGATALREPGSAIRGRDWKTIVSLLCPDDQGTGPSGPAAVLRVYHQLTLGAGPGGVGVAAAGLRQGFAAARAADWLATLATLAQAPYFGDLEELTRAALHQPAGTHDQLLVVIRRLLLATWVLSCPAAWPDPGLLGLMVDDLDYLALQHPGDRETFQQARRSWPQAFQDGRWPAGRTWTGKGLQS